MKLNIFSKNKNREEKTESKPEQIPQVADEADKKKKISKIIKSSHVTEKASALNCLNQYVFKVFSSANKFQIKRDIEQLYNVKVDAVRILTMPSKQRRLGGVEGRKPGFKKAVVKLEKGYKIEASK